MFDPSQILDKLLSLDKIWRCAHTTSDAKNYDPSIEVQPGLSNQNI